MRLARRVEQIQEEGESFIPVTSLRCRWKAGVPVESRAIRGAGGRLPARVADKVRSRGVLVVRGALTRYTVTDTAANTTSTTTICVTQGNHETTEE